MRVSTYEIILPLIGKDDKIIEGKALLVNGLYGALDVVDEATASKLREERFAEIPFALRERLTQRGHITRKDEAGELADAQLLGRVWRKLIGHSGRGPVILPTYNCNFRCPSGVAGPRNESRNGGCCLCCITEAAGAGAQSE